MSDTPATDRTVNSAVMPRRILHTMLRVRDLEASLDFYINKLGMTLLHRADFEGGRFTLAFVGYGPEESDAVLELTYNWDQAEPYEIGTGYGHIALAAPKIYEACAHFEKAGVRITRPPGPMKHGTRVIAPLPTVRRRNGRMRVSSSSPPSLAARSCLPGLLRIRCADRC